MGEKHHYGSFIWFKLGKFARIFYKGLALGKRFRAAEGRIVTASFPMVFLRCFIWAYCPLDVFLQKK